MTTILWDGRHLLADTRVSVGRAVEPGIQPKLFQMQVEDRIIWVATAGASCVARALLKWVSGPCKPEDIPKFEDLTWEAIVVTKRKGCPARAFVCFGNALEPQPSRTALGSGRDFALAALAGITHATVEPGTVDECLYAMEIAAQYDTRSGGPTAWVDTKTGDCNPYICRVDWSQLDDPFYYFVGA